MSRVATMSNETALVSALPPVPRWLSQALELSLNPDEWWKQPPLPEGRRLVARTLYEQASGKLAAPLPPSGELEAFLFEWLKTLNGGVTNSQSEADYRHKIRALVVALQAPGVDVAAAALNAGTLGVVCREFDFFPSAKKLVDLLERETQSLRARIAALRALGRDPIVAPEDPPGREPTAEEKARVAALVDRIVGNLEPPRHPRSRGLLPNRPEVEPKYASRAELEALYSQQASSTDPMVAHLGKAALDRLLAAAAEADPIPQQEVKSR